MKLSILDQSPISVGSTSADAINQTITLAKKAEEWGYSRYWIAEHHNTNGLASSSPEILMTRLATETSRIRIGSGGVLLPQYSPLKVAENFKMLEAMFPGRIDLGLGRSPGGSQKTRLALTDGYKKTLSAFPRQVKELRQFLQGTIPKGHDHFGVKATPLTTSNPDVWVLGISERGARHAANNGTGFTFGHFIDPTNGKSAISAYREQFHPVVDNDEPKVNVCIFVICAETKEQAEKLALSQDVWLLQVEKGLETRVFSHEDLFNQKFTPKEIEKMKMNRRRAIIGDPKEVKEQLTRLKDHYGTDEFLIITNIFDFQAKIRSYELLAEALL
ncbi:LLM class flavin-dependent oxidoreductase [Thalassobacillus hwangdonensis]|uniref:LLM class flavin-dependent oxidoreductase n=1 Tax=Thalassobacillus hwangdonensis TaxID=546108 RepID=A0ABW3KWX6_9BACI